MKLYISFLFYHFKKTLQCISGCMTCRASSQNNFRSFQPECIYSQAGRQQPSDLAQECIAPHQHLPLPQHLLSGRMLDKKSRIALEKSRRTHLLLRLNDSIVLLLKFSESII